ncbi:DUF3275 family protein [Xanthomonas phaseoli]|uniref:DUF3275 family protein n=1 Tax=Xanthomonas phaseoli TaxID=1985254 RepID=UPI003CCFB456
MAAKSTLQFASPIIVSGQLTLRTIRGRNGPFNVGRLVTPHGEFAVKGRSEQLFRELTIESRGNCHFVQVLNFKHWESPRSIEIPNFLAAQGVDQRFPRMQSLSNTPKASMTANSTYASFIPKPIPQLVECVSRSGPIWTE